MYTAEVSFKIIGDLIMDEAEDMIKSIADTWRMNGQNLGDERLYAKTQDAYKMYLLIPEKDALSEKYNNKYVQETIKKLESVGLEFPTVTIMDDELQDDELCDCKAPSEYLIYTTYISLSPPLRCKKCMGTIPLYKIPKLYDESDYYTLIVWRDDYQSCDSLQMNCKVGERFALRQLSSIDSQLTKDGLDV